MPHVLDKYAGLLHGARVSRFNGKITQVIGLVIEASGPMASIGELCRVEFNGIEVGHAEVVGFKADKTLLMPLGEMTGIRPGLDVVALGAPLEIRVGPGLLGRVIDGMGRPLDGKGPLPTGEARSVHAQPPNPMQRRRIKSPLWTGIRAIDGFLTLGQGQRLGIFAGSGVGKSVLLGMIARHSSADVNVIALIGERGREVREFIERDLTGAGLARSVVIVATSDQPAILRQKGALAAATVAEYFRDQGKNVMLLFDSATRVAMAQREIGLATGEPPATKSYTPSVFAFLPKLLERSGTSDKGSITGLYTVLVEGDDLDEPVADALRAILDGHLVLDRGLAQRKHYPAIDTLASISRLMDEVADPPHLKGAKRLLALLARYRAAEDLVSIGAYVKGSDPEVDKAIALRNEFNGFLTQDVNEKADFHATLKALADLARKADEKV